MGCTKVFPFVDDLPNNFDRPGVFHIAFQLLGDWWMLMGLLVLAFSPMIYLGLGAYYSITRPLSDKAISRVMVRVNLATALVALFGCFALKSANV